MVKPPKKNLGAWFIQNLKFIILALILMIVFNNYIVRIALIVLLSIIGLWSMEITRYVPYVNIELVSASAIMIGYRYDWKLACIFALIIGTWGQIKTSKFNLIGMTIIALMCFGGALANMFAKMGYDFFWTFEIVFLLKNIASFPLMQAVNPNVPKNLTHALVDGFFNIFVVVHLFTILNQLLNFLPK